MEFTIRQARREDAAFIARAVLTAIGDELTVHMAGGADRVPLVREVFTNLAAMDVSQYSYRNTLIAEGPDGKAAGAVVCYDGARLYELREAFVNEVNRLLGWNTTQAEFTDETSADEVYLDSLMVVPEYRRRGLGAMLIAEAGKKAAEAGKPLGLLVDFDNPNAKRLYTGVGFVSVGTRPFAGKEMEHLQLLSKK